MPRKEFTQLQRELEKTLRDFKSSLDVSERLELLRQLRRLLAEADRIPREELLN